VDLLSSLASFGCGWLLAASRSARQVRIKASIPAIQGAGLLLVSIQGHWEHRHLHGWRQVDVVPASKTMFSN